MLEKLLHFVAGQVVRHPWRVVSLYAVLAILSAVATVMLLELEADQNDLVGSDVEYGKRYREFLAQFEDLEFIYVVVQVKERPEVAVEVVEELASALEPLQERGLLDSVLYRVRPEELGFGLLFQDRESLENLVAWVEANRVDLSRLAGSRDFESTLSSITEMLSADRLSEGSGGEAMGEWGLKLLQILFSAMERGLDSEDYVGLEASLEQSSGLPLRERGYLATENSKFLLVEILPAKDTATVELIREPLLAVREAIDSVRARFPGVEMGLTGRPVLQADEMMTTDRDMRIVTVVALIGVFLLFVMIFRKLLRPFLAVSTLSVALLLTFGLVSITIGYLTLFSIVFAAMLVGLGIDFGIHFVARYQEELNAGRSLDDAVERTLTITGESIATGAITTAAAFYTTLLVDFEGLRELGFIAGSGVLICLISMLTLLPSLLLLADRRAERSGRRETKARPVRVPFLSNLARWPRAIIWAAVALTVVLLLGFRGVKYDFNLINLQASGLESVDYEILLIEESDTSTWYAAFVVDSVKSARQVTEKLKIAQDLGVIGQVESVVDVLPEDQAAKGAILRRGLAAVSSLIFASPTSEVSAKRLSGASEKLTDRLDELQDLLMVREGADVVVALRELDALSVRSEAMSDRLSEPGQNLQALGSAQARWISEMQHLLGKCRDALKLQSLTPETLPSVLRKRYLSKDQSQFVVFAYPRKDIWVESNMLEFLEQTRAIDPLVNGTPMHFYESATHMREGFLLAGCYSLIAVFVLLMLKMRNLGKTLLAMVPIVVGGLWLIELQSLIDLSFNLANFFAVPILIGCGVDGGVHVVDRFYECGSAEEVNKTTGAAVTLSFLTTMVGFAAMGFASHRGVASLGQLMTLGLACLLVASVTFLPGLLALLPGKFAVPKNESTDIEIEN